MGKIASSFPSSSRPRPALSLHPLVAPPFLCQRPPATVGMRLAGAALRPVPGGAEAAPAPLAGQENGPASREVSQARSSLAAHREPGAPSQSWEERAVKGRAPHGDGGIHGTGRVESRALSGVVTQASQGQGRAEPAPDVLPLFPAPHLPLETRAVNLFLAHLGGKEAGLPHPLWEAKDKPSSGHSPLPSCLPAHL